MSKSGIFTHLIGAMNLFQRAGRQLRKHGMVHVMRRLHPEFNVAVAGKQLRIDVRDRVIGSLLYSDGDYERNVRTVFAAMDLAGGVCVDIGANLGLHAIWLSEFVGASGRVVAFEPEEHNLKLLKANLRLNQATNVEIMSVALGDVTGSKILHVDRLNFGDHRIDSSIVGGTEGQDVSVMRGDDALGELRPGSIRLIKLDVQGYELKVLRGLETTLKNNPDVYLVVEVSPFHLRRAGDSPTHLIGYLSSLGFSAWEIQDHRVFPAPRPSSYELLVDGYYADLVLARDSQRLDTLMQRVFTHLS